MPPPVPRCESPPQRVRPLPVGRVLAGKKRGHGRVKTDTPWPFSVLILRDARVLKRRAILKPFCHAISGSGQASSPRQSRKSQPFVRLPPPYSPFLSIVTPYTRSFLPRGALCAHRRHPVHRSMRARPFAGAARPGGAPSPGPPLPPAPKAGQHGPAALFAAAAAPGPFPAPLSCGAGDSQESRDFFGNFPWESGKILRRCSVGGSPSPRMPFDR